jgi:hypothetical protein
VRDGRPQNLGPYFAHAHLVAPVTDTDRFKREPAGRGRSNGFNGPNITADLFKEKKRAQQRYSGFSRVFWEIHKKMSGFLENEMAISRRNRDQSWGETLLLLGCKAAVEPGEPNH